MSKIQETFRLNGLCCLNLKQIKNLSCLFLYKKTSDKEIVELLNTLSGSNSKENEALRLVKSTFSRLLEEKRKLKEQNADLASKLERCVEGLTVKHKEYNKLKRFLLSLEEDSEEEEGSFRTSSVIIDESLIGY